MSNGAPEVQTYARAVEREPSVTVTEETFFGHGWQPLTLGVLQAIWFLPQGVSFTVEDLAEWFQKLGWKSPNGRPLGVEGVRRELAHIRKAGYIQAVRTRGARGQVTGIRYEISKRPRPVDQATPWIPIDSSNGGKPSSDHVPLPTGDGGQPEKVDRRIPRSDHVPLPTAHGRPPEMVGRTFAQVAPCAVGKPHPPHPPEEVDTSSPYPHDAAARPEVGAVEHSDDDLVAAAMFLKKLPSPWTAGRSSAKRLAPKLLEALEEQGWPALAKLTPRDDALLVRELTKNPEGINDYSRILPKRVEDLPLYEVVAGAPIPSQAGPARGLPEEIAQVRQQEAPPLSPDTLAFIESMRKTKL